MKPRLWIVLVALLAVLPLAAQSPTVKERQASLSYVASLQGKDGGFAPSKLGKDKASTLGATSAAVRTGKYFGGLKFDKETAEAYVKSCYDKASGGFKDNPKGEPSVRATAIGVMAVVELRMPVEEYADAAAKYLSDNAKTFEDIRIAVAGLEAIKKQTPKAKEWIAQIEKMRNADGTYGAGDKLNRARDTASAVVAILRLGGTVEYKENVLKALDVGQLRDGGWAKADAPQSDLETTYRVMRAFYMLKAKPNVPAVQRFVASCRTEGGGYALQVNSLSAEMGPTYFASIITYWLDGMK